ncbi:MAG: hypothetical protein JWQ35_479 [Bacteriovoracaceae bacterium]|nr:hypothetical protein [Bacteriovoracaceae bacterium]
MDATTFHTIAVKEFSRGLKNLKLILDKFQTYAETKKFEPSNVLNGRLAPDQFSFTRQIQIMCDIAKFNAARLTAKEAPVHEDKEQTIDDLRGRIDKTIAYLQTLSVKDFEGASTRKIKMPRIEGKAMQGDNYFAQFGIPNFYFHFTMAYAILRNNGLDIGKKDYLGELTLENI